MTRHKIKKNPPRPYFFPSCNGKHRSFFTGDRIVCKSRERILILTSTLWIRSTENLTERRTFCRR